MYGWLQEAVSEEREVVTASRRLARELRDAYNRKQLAAGHQSWLTPAIVSWQDWLSWQLDRVPQPAQLPRVIDAASSALLWERCLRLHCPDGLPGFGGLVRQAMQSWMRSQDWNCSVKELREAARSQDERIFAEAAREYRQRLSDNNWIDTGGKAGLVSRLLDDGTLAPSCHVTFAGFNRVSPAVRDVMAALKRSGTTVAVAPAATNTGTPGIVSYDHADAELRAAGAWARAQLDDDPAAKIAIVVPGLESGSASATRLIREGLVPGWQYGGSAFVSAANVSYGRKLSEYPAISTALLVLRWVNQALSSREVSLLLRSRCLASDVTKGRSRLEKELRGHPDRQWSPEDFFRVFDRDGEAEDARQFLECVSTLADMRGSQDERERPGEWVRRIDALLTTVHWPGAAALDSEEFQLVNRWRELLNEYARIEIVSPLVDFGEVVRRLGSMSGDILYQPDAGPGVVQVLGILEATGMEFDRVWVSGMDSSQWPPASTPARFISLSLQRRHRMPDATPGDTLEFARQVLRGFATSAECCVFSSVTASEELELTPTSILDELGCAEIKHAEDPGWFANALLASSELPLELEDPIPPVGAHEKIRGGAYTVQRQFVEPFGAFAHGRLGVQPLEVFAPGLSPGVRGNIIHSALHNLLASRPSQDEIACWTAEERLRRVGSAVDAALAEYGQSADTVLTRILRLERGRLLQLLENFLVAETNRIPFTVADVERKVDYNKFGIELGLRVDRIDRLADGRLLVIDYKTGIPKNFLDRDGGLTDLQLVVYADALQDEVGGLALINIDSRTIESRGAGAGGSWSQKYADGWEPTLNLWRAEVHRVIKEIVAGDARVNTSFSVTDDRPLRILSRKGVRSHVQ